MAILACIGFSINLGNFVWELGTDYFVEHAGQITVEEAGLKIGHMGKNYLTVHDPESGDKLRLKGGIYAEQCILTGRETADQNRERKAGDRSPVSGELSRLAAAFTSVIEKRTGYNRKRYPRKPCTAGAEHQLPLPDYGDGIQPSLSAGLPVELCNPDCVGAIHLGPADAVTVPNQGVDRRFPT